MCSDGRMHSKTYMAEQHPKQNNRWLQELLVPVVTDLAKLAGPRQSRSHPGAEKSVRLAVSMLAKTVLQVTPCCPACVGSVWW